MSYKDQIEIGVEIAGRDYIAVIDVVCSNSPPVTYDATLPPWERSEWDVDARVASLWLDTGHTPPQRALDCPQWLSDAIVETFNNEIEQAAIDRYEEHRADQYDRDDWQRAAE